MSTDKNSTISDYQVKLANLEKLQSFMVATNKIVRKFKTFSPEALAAMRQVEGYENISDAKIEAMFSPDFAGRVGFPSYKLTNNNATIKATKDRIAVLTKKEAVETGRENIELIFAHASIPNELGTYGTVRVNYEIDRLQILFEGKPSEQVREVLKRNGFKWAPSEGAWQRQLTDNARYSTRSITGIDVAQWERSNPVPAPSSETDKSEEKSDGGFFRESGGIPVRRSYEPSEDDIEEDAFNREAGYTS